MDPSPLATADPGPDAACPHCGTPREADAVFCIQCGRRLDLAAGRSLASGLIARPGPAGTEAVPPRPPQPAAEASRTARTARTGPPPAPASDLEPGTRLSDGRFLVGEPIGERGAETLFEATDLQANEPVILHRIVARRLEAGAGDRLRARLAALRGLHHPGLVAVHEAGQHGGIDFYVTERVEGPTLEQVLASRVEGFTLNDAAHIVMPLLDALEHVHPRFVHGGVEPGRVIFAHGDATQPKLEPVVAPADDEGDAAYRAPEQMRRRGIDHRTDLYAMGVLLYRLLTGELPGPGSARPSALRPRLPKGVDPLIAALLQRNPDQRPASAGEVRSQVRSLCAQELRRLRGGAPGWLQEHGRTAALAIGVIALAAIAGVFAVDAMRRQAERRDSSVPPPVAAAPAPAPSAPSLAPPAPTAGPNAAPDELAAPAAEPIAPAGPAPSTTAAADEAGASPAAEAPAGREGSTALAAPSAAELPAVSAPPPVEPTAAESPPAPPAPTAAAAAGSTPTAVAGAAASGEAQAAAPTPEEAARLAAARERAIEESYRAQWTPQMRDAALAAQREWADRNAQGTVEESVDSLRAEQALERARTLDEDGKAREAWAAYGEALDAYRSILGPGAASEEPAAPASGEPASAPAPSVSSEPPAPETPGTPSETSDRPPAGP